MLSGPNNFPAQTAGRERGCSLCAAPATRTTAHTLLHLVSDLSELEPAALEILSLPRTNVWTTAASAWEIGIKTRLGRLDGEILLSAWFGVIADMSIVELPVDSADATLASRLPLKHRDPFARPWIPLRCCTARRPARGIRRRSAGVHLVPGDLNGAAGTTMKTAVSLTDCESRTAACQAQSADRGPRQRRYRVCTQSGFLEPTPNTRPRSIRSAERLMTA
jgi:PIN domain nuclease of toxin-antitoxin system